MPKFPLTHRQKTQRLTRFASLVLILLLVLAGAIGWHDYNRSNPTLSAPAQLASIRIERPGFTDIVLQQEPASRGIASPELPSQDIASQDIASQDTQVQATAPRSHWVITEPCRLNSNPQRLQPLLDALHPASLSYAAGEVDLEAAGLIEPEAVIVLDGEALALGSTDLSGERRYLLRGDRVEFVPEWVLSLINGGLSAMAQLNVFTQELEQLTVSDYRPIDEKLSVFDGQTVVAAEELAAWQSLSAQQIVSWPLPTTEDAAETGSREISVQAGGSSMNLTLHRYSRFVAIRFENADCAYIMAESSLPESVLP